MALDCIRRRPQAIAMMIAVDGELVCWVDGRGILPAASAAVAARFYSQVRHRGGGARP